jgi:carboxypeptidase C (cathepsin A)
MKRFRTASFTLSTLLVLTLLAPAAPLGAQPPHAMAGSPKGDAGKAKAEIPEPQVFVTRHQGTFNGQTVRYTATAGETYLRDDEGEPTAAVFSIAYVEEGVEDPTTRPVTFLWNGGPGSSSVWLHMGAFGPKRVVVPSDGEDDGAPPYRLVDNPYTPLDVTDIVMVDPVGTGFSRPLGEHEGKEFWGVSEDAQSVAQFIRQWLSDNGRWASPKYIGGESYGTTRSAAVARELSERQGTVALNGIILISAVMDFYTSGFQTGNELGYVTYLPTMAATAWYHGKVEPRPESVDAFVAEARQFAVEEYLPALFAGNALEEERRDRIRERLSYFTGISEDYFRRSDLRITDQRFYKELLRDEGLVVGRLDGRYTGEDLDDAGETPEDDPSMYGIDGAYTAAINAYLARDLGVTLDRPYNIFGNVFRDWNWEVREQGFRAFNLNVAPYIGTAMRQNDDLRVLVAAGYYDFATPFFDAELSFRRNGIVPERIEFTYYEAGHMMYVHEPSLERFLGDVREFIAGGP